MYTDPIADLITRIRNGYLAKKLYVTVPYSRLKGEVVRVLAEQGWVGEVKVNTLDEHRKEMTIYLSYDEEGKPVVKQIKKVSKPGRRQYWGKNEIPTVRGGFGMVVMTTSKGVMSGEQARREGIGGEPLVIVY